MALELTDVTASLNCTIQLLEVVEHQATDPAARYRARLALSSLWACVDQDCPDDVGAHLHRASLIRLARHHAGRHPRADR